MIQFSLLQYVFGQKLLKGNQEEEAISAFDANPLRCPSTDLALLAKEASGE